MPMSHLRSPHTYQPFHYLWIHTPLMAEANDNIRYDEEFIFSPRGLKLFTCRWLPINKDPKALIFVCHGYAMECSISMRGTAIRLARAGFAVYGMDYEGHGKSSGLQGYIPSFDGLVDDCSHHFMSICEKQENKRKQRFLFGESMGGAVVLFLHRKQPTYWNGAVLVAPMCKISLPFLIVHGGDDVVTDPSISKLLYESASSKDKTFKLYHGMWHALTSAEPAESVDLVFSDIVVWLDERAVASGAMQEIESKAKHESDAELMIKGRQPLPSN